MGPVGVDKIHMKKGSQSRRGQSTLSSARLTLTETSQRSQEQGERRWCGAQVLQRLGWGCWGCLGFEGGEDRLALR